MVLVTFATLDGRKHIIELDHGASIAVAKEALFKVIGIPANLISLLFRGNVPTNDDTIGHLNMKHGEFIIVRKVTKSAIRPVVSFPASAVTNRPKSTDLRRATAATTTKTTPAPERPSVQPLPELRHDPDYSPVVPEGGDFVDVVLSSFLVGSDATSAERPRRPSSESEEFTKEENLMITRLQELGFSRSDVISVFIACDRDEQLTACCLLSLLDK